MPQLPETSVIHLTAKRCEVEDIQHAALRDRDLTAIRQALVGVTKGERAIPIIVVSQQPPAAS
jgi:hypothetical protein